MTGRAERDAIMARYGNRQEVEARAAAGDSDAADALWSLALFEEDPTRLEEETVVEDVMTLGREEVSRLTPKRLQLLEELRRLGEASLKELTEAVRRDVKNVSQDVTLLESFGLIEAARQGKERRLRVAGNEVLLRV